MLVLLPVALQLLNRGIVECPGLRGELARKLYRVLEGRLGLREPPELPKMHSQSDECVHGSPWVGALNRLP